MLELTQVVDEDEESSAKHGTVPSRAPDVAVQEDAGRNGSVFLLPPLDHNEANNKNTEKDE
jgi:hypothetical protein